MIALILLPILTGAVVVLLASEIIRQRKIIALQRKIIENDDQIIATYEKLEQTKVEFRDTINQTLNYFLANRPTAGLLDIAEEFYMIGKRAGEQVTDTAEK